MADYTSIAELIQRGADSDVAIAAPDRAPLDYRGLRGLAGTTTGALNGFGIGRGDRIAIVLPNGPEMAAAFVAIGHGATTAPLNPGYRADEFEFYLTDLGARALVVAEGMESPAIEVAARLGVGLIDLVVPAGAPAGSFTLRPR